MSSAIIPVGTALEIPIDSFGVFRAFDDDGDGHFDFLDHPVILPVSPVDFCKMTIVPLRFLPKSSVEKLDQESVQLLTATESFCLYRVHSEMIASPFNSFEHLPFD